MDGLLLRMTMTTTLAVLQTTMVKKVTIVLYHSIVYFNRFVWKTFVFSDKPERSVQQRFEFESSAGWQGGSVVSSMSSDHQALGSSPSYSYKLWPVISVEQDGLMPCKSKLNKSIVL